MRYATLIPCAALLALAACTPAPINNADAAVTVIMNDAGFSPEKLTINQNDKVCWKNDDDDGRWPASNIHPTHEIYSAFDPKAPMKPGETWCFTFDQRGIWQFHDHLLPEFTGTVTVN